MDDLKLGLKLMPHAYGTKIVAISSIFLMLAGIAIEVLSKGAIMFGGVLIFVVSMYPTQLLTSLAMSGLVATSTKNRRIQIRVNLIWEALLGGVMILVVAGIRYALYLQYPEMEGMIVNGMLFAAAWILAITVYNGIAYKYFVAGMIGFLVVFLAVYETFMIQMNENPEAIVGFPVAVAIMIAAFVIGLVIQYFLMSVLYKVPFSLRSQGAKFKKNML